MKPSASTVSDLLCVLYDNNKEINACLLIGEKVDLIHEAGEVYNHLRSMVTPTYFLDEEYEWLKALGNEWNEEVRSYQVGMGGNCTESETMRLEDLSDEIQRALDELNGDMGP